MDKENRKILYTRASNKWGIPGQMTVACEELAELIVEIAKHINGKRRNKIGLIDELADARIMIEQIENIFDLETKVKDRMAIKLGKLMKIVNK